jgi:hypothetical protein
MAFRVRTVLEEQAEKEVMGKPAPDIKPTSEPVRKIDDPLPEAKPRLTTEPPQEKTITVPPFQRNYQPLATVEALGCLFDLRNVRVIKDGLHIMIEVINTDAAVRSVAFYDERFGRWAKSRIYDESDKYYDTTSAFVIKDNQRTMMYDIDSRGRGVAIPPQTSMTMELIFANIPANTKTVKIHLHPFIYYPRGWGQTWQEFDLPITPIRLHSEAQSPKQAPSTAEQGTTPMKAEPVPAPTAVEKATTPAQPPAKAKTVKKKKVPPQ